MSVRLGSAASDAPASRHYLLGGWRGVVEDVRRLSSELRRSPGVCACGHVASSSGGRCPCCEAGTPQTGCVDCAAQVKALGTKLDTLFDHTLRHLPAIADMLGARAATGESKQLKAVRLHIGVVDGTFRRLVTASAEFRHGCSASHIRVVATLADQLLFEAWALEHMLEPTARRWTELQDIQRERDQEDDGSR